MIKLRCIQEYGHGTVDWVRCNLKSDHQGSHEGGSLRWGRAHDLTIGQLEAYHERIIEIERKWRSSHAIDNYKHITDPLVILRIAHGIN